MIKRLICLFVGHKKYKPKELDGHSFITLRNALGNQVVTINVCERCKEVYAEFKEKSTPGAVD